jgi:hypothetical protein
MRRLEVKKISKCIVLLTVSLILFPSVNAQQRGSRLNTPQKSAKGEKSYEAYVGQYLMRSIGPERTRIITITKVGDKLIVERDAHRKAHWNKFELFPVSSEKFIHRFDSDSDNEPWAVSITFVKDASGRIPQIIYAEESGSNNTQKETADRISSLKPYLPTSQKLLEYTGRYKAEGKDGREVIVNITHEGGVLFFDTGRLRNGVVEKTGLFPDQEDRFLLKGVRTIISFMRDSEGRITHLISEGENGKAIARRL